MEAKTIKVGDIIYIDTELYVSHGVDDMIGGKVRVVKVGEDCNGRIWISTELDPAAQYNWEMLSQEQAKLEQKFQDNWAYNRPDCKPEFNDWSSE
ncbi:MAG: hypothetical protein NT105_14970 [Verrucomicrobia bacterium]|nr:hypothetical protein [Verrucomicrobiota bacterium]